MARLVPLPSCKDAADLLRAAKLNRQTQEVMVVVAYDSLMQARTVIEVARGGYHMVEVSIPAVMTAVLTAGTDRFLIAHNHSSSDVTPTVVDIDLTRKIMAAANTCGLFFEDHLILGPGDEEFSMTDAGILIPAPELKKMASQNKRMQT